MIGESPTRPAIFQASPLVVVTPDISPFSFNARQLMVPCGGFVACSHASASIYSLACGNSCLSLCNCAVFRAAGGASSPGPQLLCPCGSFSDRFQTSHDNRDCSVSRSSSGKP